MPVVTKLDSTAVFSPSTSFRCMTTKCAVLITGDMAVNKNDMSAIVRKTDANQNITPINCHATTEVSVIKEKNMI